MNNIKKGNTMIKVMGGIIGALVLVIIVGSFMFVNQESAHKKKTKEEVATAITKEKEKKEKEEKEAKKKYIDTKEILPLGSVVITKKGDTPLMIVSRASLYGQEENIGYFDYAAVIYPKGVEDVDKFVFFNREDVDSILSTGYINDDEKQFAKNYEKLIKGSGYKKLSLEGK